MFDIMKTQAPWDDMWRNMAALMEYPWTERGLENNGLKTLIRKPHNIVNVKDNDGKTVAQRLEVVTTPFKKEDVKVTINDNTLSVECGSESKEEKTDEDYIYKGISSQSYTFAIKLSDKVDREAIKAKNVDGVLTVTLPFKGEEEPKKITSIEVE